ncbi:MAG: branched-chain amino acid ABC transporter substrate-binding protein [Alphaproteobacteria bacterium]|jgi:branched-chain amino acid transport system substrate-binding protein|nr:branched-chain amino acid ABC transporter substrate-binding protein [Alphaproteobacteria bacterium]MBT4084569.1 branched-chain amino acid ABC transporter substrate-binding protein [Alphaproteobacteria bacterium]MBT4544616.1 branched-chain amino acid ABC transporter substrate-binding protein [Alphaproteobacteria bacterium]MBT7745739.1 branched-chain amino acid ABC transporter substrate-binding protein [Alphaproteobacteria bacterium]
MSIFRNLTAGLMLSGLLLPVAAEAEITIAVVGAMAGPFEKIGKEFKQGTRGAVKEINDGGGLLGQKVKFIVRDDNCNPEEAKKIASEIVELDIAFVMGHLCSDASIAASDIYEKHNLLAMSPSSTSPELTDRGYNLAFRTTGRDDMQGFVLAEHILRNFKTKRLAVIYDDNGYSKGLTKTTGDFVKKGGMKDIYQVMAPKAEPFDFSAIIARMKKDNIQLAFYPGLPGPVLAFARQIKEAKLKVRLLGSDAFSGIKFDDSNRRLLDGAQFSFAPDPKDDRRNKKLVKWYKSEGYSPEAFAFYSYGAVQVWAKAVKAAGTLDAAKVAQTLRSKDFDTVLGKISFDDKGDISNPGFVLYFINKGKRYYLD